MKYRDRLKLAGTNTLVKQKYLTPLAVHFVNQTCTLNPFMLLSKVLKNQLTHSVMIIRILH